MPAEVYEDVRSLLCEGVYAVDGYPLPLLQPSGVVEEHRVRVAVLQNRLLRVVVALDLGGRILETTDLRTGVDVVKVEEPLRLVQAGSRGADLPLGLEVVVGERVRANSLGPVDHQVRGELLVLHELVPLLGIGWHASLSLAEDRPILRLDLRAVNRRLRPVRAELGLRLCGASSLAVGPNGVLASGPQGGLALLFEPGRFTAELAGGELALLAGSGAFGPRQVRDFSVRIVPVTGMASVGAFGEAGAFALAEDSVMLQVASESPGRRLVISAGGKDYDAPVEARLGPPVSYPLGGLPRPDGVALKSAEGEVELAWPSLDPAASGRRGSAVHDALLDPPDGSVERALFEGDALAAAEAQEVPGLQAAAKVLLAQYASLEGKHARAAELLQEALGYNAEDHLAWWALAATRRLSGQAAEDKPELLNAHYLAPLEPVLRLEAFLAAPTPGREVESDVLAPLAQDPESAREAVCALLDFGLYADATRAIDELLRRASSPVLTYLQAWVFLTQSRMAVEAAQLVAGLAAEPVEPPYPWREAEKRAIAELAERFPDDTRLAQLARLTSQAR